MDALEECPDQRWFNIEGDCFLFVVTPATFQDAEITCQQQAQHSVLAKINPVDPKYRLFLESRPLTGIFAPHFLIGLSDTVTEGEFRWLDGTWPTEVNWAEGHPVHISREVEDRLDCVIINDAGQWESVQCIQSYSFVCAVLDGTVPGTEFNECTAPGAAEQICLGPNDFCEDAAAGYHCVCFPGYRKNDNNQCEEIACDAMCSGQNEFCLNKEPPNDDSCECLPGFVRTKDGLYCVSANVDETCTSNSDLCNTADLICQDGATIGEYRCECIQGFVRETSTGNCIESSFLNSVSTCALNPELCDGFRERCVDGKLTGSYMCVCQGGYAYVNGVCTEQAACVGSPCTVDSEVCVDLPEGRYRCDCAAGYTRRDGVCTGELDSVFNKQLNK
ncbi:hypothetical protein BSL78_22936 [Apostichopus japonicus]|uniref:C-type lectin domain-containing protein n=1 Tax=Stichopus japonicus TaxID=307972 RepID=A0A2G8JWT1_STIJA|nr:hypothetical protein BSL78_22936 [Apostichopus japonicus]